MKRDVAEKWIADLRANPPQAKEVLFDGRGHCCLGRLCVLYGLTPEHDIGSVDYYFLGERLSLPGEVVEWAGMDTDDGTYIEDDSDKHHNLAILNDSGKSFSEIADIIAAHVDEL